MQLKKYQKDKIDELVEKAKNLLNYSGSKKMIFKSPTGSGKTIMIAEFLKQLVEDNEIRQPLSFIWAAPRQLHIQSKEELEDYFKNTCALRCSYFEDLHDKQINDEEMLFFNWESMNKSDNIYIRDNEQKFNLSNILEKTKDGGREIVLIIDEAHHHATSVISQKLIDDIRPKLTVEVSATPVIENPDEIISIQHDDVRSQGMIKKAVILNDNFKNIIRNGKIKSSLSNESHATIISIALKKRMDLLKAYKKEKTKINPLVLIQLPDRIGKLEDETKDKIIKILQEKHKISIKNKKLAIWLSGEHLNKKYVERSDSAVEVLIFKQAIALGWDCPRAQILVLFREWHSPTFSIQTVGRIMRMPEPKKGHYKSDILNYAYVYTNLEDIVILEDIARDYISVFTSKRISKYRDVNLVSCHYERHRETTRLSILFIDIFLKIAKRYNLKARIDKKSKKLNHAIISDWKADDIDKLGGTKIQGKISIKMSGFDIQRLLDYFVRKYLSPFYPEDRSVGRVKESIYKYFYREYGMNYKDKQEEIIRIVLGSKNIDHFVNVIDKAKEEYKKQTIKREPELSSKDIWNIPESLRFNSKYTVANVNKSVMKPFFTTGKWKTESHFIRFLEGRRNKIKWWFQNGSRDATFFAVPYNDGLKKPFYVDFIVQLRDGRIGLFDTKSGFTKKEAGPKIDGLYKYIQSQNKMGKKLFGGITTNTDSRNYRGRWIYFDKPVAQFKDSNFDNWKDSEL